MGSDGNEAGGRLLWTSQGGLEAQEWRAVGARSGDHRSDPGENWDSLSKASVLEMERSRPDVWYYFRGRMGIICWRISIGVGHSCSIGVGGLPASCLGSRGGHLAKPYLTEYSSQLCEQPFLSKSSNKWAEARKDGVSCRKSHSSQEGGSRFKPGCPLWSYPGRKGVKPVALGNTYRIADALHSASLGEPQEASLHENVGALVPVK